MPLRSRNSYYIVLPLKGLDQALRLALNLEDSDGAVAGACRKLSAVVVEDCIVLRMC